MENKNEGPVTSQTTHAPRSLAPMEEEKPVQHHIPEALKKFWHGDILYSPSLQVNGLLTVYCRDGIEHRNIQVQCDEDKYYQDYKDSPRYAFSQKAQAADDWRFAGRPTKLDQIQTKMEKLIGDERPWHELKKIYDQLRVEFYEERKVYQEEYFGTVKWFGYMCKTPYIDCRISFSNYDFYSVENYIQKDLRQKQEYKKFKEGDFTKTIEIPGTDIYPPAKGLCLICQSEQDHTFSFDPTGGEYGPYHICPGCIRIVNSHLNPL